MKHSVMIFFFLACASANAKNCQSNAKALVKKKLQKECAKASCKLKAEEVTNVTGYVDEKGKETIKKDEKLFRISQDPAGRVFEVVVKASDCKLVNISEIGSSDD
jgi:hypothetical protein